MLIDNKKTREISWNDFELEGNKENLIKQGWESFEPYGFGEFIGKAPEEVFEESYRYNFVIDSKEVRKNTGTPFAIINFSKPLSPGTYTLSFKDIEVVEGVLGSSYRLSPRYVGGGNELLFPRYNEKFVKMELVKECDRLFLYPDTEIEVSREQSVIWKNVVVFKGEINEFVWYPNWQDLPDEEKPADAYEKGYTYMQDWGLNNWYPNELRNGDFRHELNDWVISRDGSVSIYADNKLNIILDPTSTGLVYQTIDTISDDIYYVFTDVFVEGVGGFWTGLGGHSGSQRSVYVNLSNFQGENRISIVDKGSNFDRVILGHTSRVEEKRTYIADFIGVVNLTKLFGKGNEPSQEECDELFKDYSPHISELPEDELGIRIRTKGGDTDMKLKSPNFGQLAETGTDMTISLYVENNSDSMIRFSNNLAIGGVPYPDGVKYMITVPREYKGFAYLKGELVGRDVELDIRSDGNIDMIVSQPEIIEGHDLNAMLFIEDLDDGRKHVQVHNVNENTKLVYTGGGVIKGEPYTLETEIENDGRIFNLSANMFDSVVEVQKGMNDIRKSGELQDKELKIEIGVG